MNTAPRIFNPDTGEFEPLPFKWEICPGCQGHGKSSAYLGAFTGAEMREDPDFAQDYMDGFYDRTCECCHGKGRVQVADLKKMTKKQKRAWREEAEADARYAAEIASERWMKGWA